MGDRIKINIFYNYNENWIGGTYYIQNLVHALNTLPDDEKPLLLVSSDEKQFTKLKQETNYPYLTKWNNYRKLNLSERVINKITRVIAKRNVIGDKIKRDLICFPSKNHQSKSLNSKSIFWIPDFQEKHLPHFFSDEELRQRDERHDLISKVGKFIVFSSMDAKADFNRYYPKNKVSQNVLSFAVTHPTINEQTIEKTLLKFNINEPYFLCSNQFWVHKNHKIVFSAIAMLKSKNINVKVIFTGQTNDYRNPNYFNELQSCVEELNISQNIVFLGFIARDEQLALLKKAKAIIQPSLFEGWSTSIEDSKVHNKYIIASDLPVHQEQLKHYPNYNLFDPNSAAELANVLSKDHFNEKYYDYAVDVQKFAKSFQRLISEINEQ